MSRRRTDSDVVTWIVLAAIVVLVGVSLLSQSNADWYSGRAQYDSQVIWFVIGGIAFALSAVVDLRIIERISYVVYGLFLVLLVLTAFVGTEVNSSRRWLRFGGVGLQASEFMKIGLILALARFFHGRKERIPGERIPSDAPYSLSQLFRPAMMLGVPAFLVLGQPDLGTTIVLVLVAGTMVLFEGVTRRSLVIVAAAFLFVVPVAWKYGGIKNYQKDRVVGCINDDWLKLDPETALIVDNRSLQSEQAIWAIGSGQFWGQGSRAGAQSRLKYLPEMHTDMIIATFAEEQGFIGCTFLLFLFWIVVLWCIRSAVDARSRYCRLLAVGVAAMLGWQVFINIGMVVGLLPIVGLPLPLISYGGSSLLTTMLSLGLVFNVAIRRGRL